MISYAAAILTALLNAASNVLNRKATRDEPARFEFRLRLITDLMRRRTWLGVLALAAAVVVLSRSPGMQGAAGQNEEEARRRVGHDEAA